MIQAIQQYGLILRIRNVSDVMLEVVEWLIVIHVLVVLSVQDAIKNI